MFTNRVDGSRVAERVEWGSTPSGVGTVWSGAIIGGPTESVARGG